MLLQRLGLQRKPLPASELPPEPAPPARRWGVRVLLFASLVALTVFAFPQHRTYVYNVDVGDVWRDETLVAPYAFPVLKTPEQVRAERRAVRMEAPPLFARVPDALARMEAGRDTVLAQLHAIAEAYATYKRHVARGEPDTDAEAARIEGLRRDARVKLTADQWRRLLDEYTLHIPDLAPAGTPVRRGLPLYAELVEKAMRASASLTAVGVTDVPRDSILSEYIYVRNEETRVDEPLRKDELYGINEAYELAQEQVAKALPDSVAQLAIATSFIRELFQPSLLLLRRETAAEWARRENRISPSMGAVMDGEIIVERGQRVTEESLRKITSLAAAQRERGGVPFVMRVVLGQTLLATAILLLFYLYLYLLRRQIFDDDKMLLLATLVLGIIIALFAVAVRIENVRPYAVPVAVASVLLTVLFDSRVGVFGTLSLALVGGHLVGGDLEFTFATLFACTLVVFSVRDIKNRGQIFFASGMLIAAYAFVLATMRLLIGTTAGSLEQDLVYAAINAFLLLFSYPLVWVFERLFGVTTDLTLLELSNTNRPLLRELSQRAPGTFNHVLQVANLAEACADAIGANALLTRVGALYHDIGKMKRPEIFVENQGTEPSPHTDLPAAVSAAYITEHVPEGVRIGKKHNLPAPVLHFIPTHHGTTRVEFFYRKAVEAEKEGGPHVDERAFRYQGPRPDSKETGILMLSDSTEAASRTLDDPTPENLARLIDGIVKARLNDGQFDRSELTFSELTRVRETLLKMLTSIHHSRIKYPEPVEDKPAPPLVMRTPEAAEKPAAPVTSGPEPGGK